MVFFTVELQRGRGMLACGVEITEVELRLPDSHMCPEKGEGGAVGAGRHERLFRQRQGGPRFAACDRHPPCQYQGEYELAGVAGLRAQLAHPLPIRSVSGAAKPRVTST